jgi:hypothetical protein
LPAGSAEIDTRIFDPDDRELGQVAALKIHPHTRALIP